MLIKVVSQILKIKIIVMILTKILNQKREVENLKNPEVFKIQRIKMKLKKKKMN